MRASPLDSLPLSMLLVAIINIANLQTTSYLSYSSRSLRRNSPSERHFTLTGHPILTLIENRLLLTCRRELPMAHGCTPVLLHRGKIYRWVIVRQRYRCYRSDLFSFSFSLHGVDFMCVCSTLQNKREELVPCISVALFKHIYLHYFLEICT